MPDDEVRKAKVAQCDHLLILYPIHNMVLNEEASNVSHGKNSY